MPIKEPRMIDIAAIIGAAFLSFSDTIIMIGIDNARAMMLPCNHQTIPGKLQLSSKLL
jgi:hypothetical protein